MVAPFEYIQSHEWPSNLIETILYFLVLYALRLMANYALEKRKIESNELRIRWKVQIRNTSFVLFVLGAVIIWAAELKTLALSLVAVAVAVIIATKELIMCFTGSLLKISSRSFSIGDRIVVGEFRGDVIDQTLLTTTLMEIGPGKSMHQQTGRAITIPNSIFVSSPVINESYRQDYILHGISIPIKLDTNWKKAAETLRQIAVDVCAPYFEEAEKQLVRSAKERNVVTPRIEPRVSLTVQGAEQVTLILRVPAPVRERGSVEQAILQGFLSKYLPVG